MQREMPTATDHLHFGQRAERGDDADAKVQRVAGGTRKIAEEFWRGVGKRIVAERANGDRWDAMRGTENGGLREQQQVAAGQIDSLVGRCGVGNAATGDTPVRAVEIADGKGEDGEREDSWSVESGAWSEGAEKFAQRAPFSSFPHKPVTDEDGINFCVAFGQLGQHHATVEAAADQGADGTA